MALLIAVVLGGIVITSAGGFIGDLENWGGETIDEDDEELGLDADFGAGEEEEEVENGNSDGGNGDDNDITPTDCPAGCADPTDCLAGADGYCEIGQCCYSECDQIDGYSTCEDQLECSWNNEFGICTEVE